jgi:hypothetical protein
MRIKAARREFFANNAHGVRIVLVITTALVLAFGLAARFDPLPQGLTATYYPDTAWAGPPLKTVIEPVPSTATMMATWQNDLPPTYSATWTGSLVVPRTGTYTFATASDDGSWLFVDGHPVVENGGRHERRLASATIRLDRGVHGLFLKYVQEGDAIALELLWDGGGGPLVAVPAWALWTRRTEFARTLVSVVVWRGFRVAVLVWLASLAVAGAAFVARRAPRWIAASTANPYHRALTAIVVASVALNLVGITWGLPSEWVGDEVTPTLVMLAWGQHFTNGWFARYPPLQYYVLTMAYAPWLALKAFGWLRLTGPAEELALLLVARVIGIAFGAGTVVAVYACGARAFGHRAAVCAAGLVALLTPFVFYAKTANPEVPYVFWFAVSLAFYVRALGTLRLRDIVLSFVAGAAAVCTKDQAYPLFLSMPFVLAYCWVRAGRRLADWRLWIGPVAGAIVFLAIHNVPFNAAGFVKHVRDITGPGRAYRMFEPTLKGQFALLKLTVDLDRRSWGYPFFLVTLGGALVALADRSRRFVAIALLLVAATYYAGFIGVILYTYDRYVLPICVVQALFGGVAIEWLLARRLRPVVVALFVYTALYAGTVDVLMWRDSRYAAERWLIAHAPRGRLVATVFPLVTEPRTQAFDTVDIGTIENLQRWKPDYFVLNADYARAVAADTRPAALVEGLRRETLGYRLAFTYRTPSPWPWLPGAHPDLVGARDGTPVTSFLRNINPSIEIYTRASERVVAP